jgi:hypothetical protein
LNQGFSKCRPLPEYGKPGNKRAVSIMKSFFEWMQEGGVNRQIPWLILGKGPSFSKKEEFDLTSYNTLSLNDAVRSRPVDVAHAIDLQVVERSGDAIRANARVLVMPWHPHVNFHASDRSLDQLAADNPVLKRLQEEGRLLWYNLSSASSHRPDSPVVEVKYFSAEAAINLLAISGASTIRTLGVDGGRNYSAAFVDLNSKSLLANGRSSFDRQFEEFARTILKTGIDLAPLDIESPIRIYVATTEAQMLAVKVLEYSIKKHASMSTKVLPMHLSGIEIPQPKDPGKRPRTPFSFQRFLIPQLSGYRGKAIYLDSDMQVFGDIKDLWTMPMNGAKILAASSSGYTGRRPQFSVMLLDCNALDWDVRRIVSDLDAGALSYEDLMYRMTIADTVRADIDPKWNSLEKFRRGHTALLHYTDMEKQPWVTTINPLGYLWCRDLLEALDAGWISREYVDDHVRRGYVRPSLLYQLEHRVEEALLLPASALSLDEKFSAPYEEISGPKQKQRPSYVHRFQAHLRRFYRGTALSKLETRMRNRMSM